jgi:hypothetical protein
VIALKTLARPLRMRNEEGDEVMPAEDLARDQERTREGADRERQEQYGKKASSAAQEGRLRIVLDA